jgi:hypothetical protein
MLITNKGAKITAPLEWKQWGVHIPDGNWYKVNNTNSRIKKESV